MIFHGEFGLKLALQSAPQYTLPELIQFAQQARDSGFAQVWVNDNLGQRNLFVVLAAIAARVPIKLGTAIVVPYFRNPVDIADSLAALSELTEGRELSVGIARGEAERAGQQIEMPRPIAIVHEATVALQALFAGETISFRSYPALAAYHHILPDKEFRLAFLPAGPVGFYGGGHGPRMLKVCGETMDGIFFGDHFIPVARSGRAESLIDIARSAAKVRGKKLFDICELDISIARDRRRALDFARPYAAQVLLHLNGMGFGADEYRGLGLEPRLIASMKEAYRDTASLPAAAALLSDEAVKVCFVAGSPEECREQLLPLLSEAERLGFGQVAFAKLGPDYGEAIPLLSEICHR